MPAIAATTPRRIPLTIQTPAFSVDQRSLHSTTTVKGYQSGAADARSLGGAGSTVTAGPRSPGELSRAEGSRSPARFVRISMRLFSVGRRFGLAAEYG